MALLAGTASRSDDDTMSQLLADARAKVRECTGRSQSHPHLIRLLGGPEPACILLSLASLDADGNGTIDKEELRTHLKTFTKYSYKAISNIYKLLDVNEDGEIERSELRDAFVKYSALRQAIGEGPNFK